MHTTELRTLGTSTTFQVHLSAKDARDRHERFSEDNKLKAHNGRPKLPKNTYGLWPLVRFHLEGDFGSAH